MSKSSRRQEAMLGIENLELYSYFRERLINLALSQFEWHNLPETVDRYYFEKILLTNGSCVFFTPKDTDLWLAMGYVTNSQFDPYGRPVGVRPIDFNGRQHEASRTHILYDNNNENRSPLMLGINLHARRLYEVEQTFRSNVRQQNTPYIVAANGRGEQNSLKELFRRVFNFEPVLGVTKVGTMSSGGIKDSIDVLQTGVPYIGKDLFETRQMVWKDALSMLGITAETTKKERLLDDEITINRQEDMIALQSRLLNRVEFCNKMNDMYDMNLQVNTSDVSVSPIDAMREDDESLAYDRESENDNAQ